VEPHYLNTVLCKASHASYGWAEWYRFVSHEGHDFRCKIKNEAVKCTQL